MGLIQVAAVIPSIKGVSHLGPLILRLTVLALDVPGLKILHHIVRIGGGDEIFGKGCFEKIAGGLVGSVVLGHLINAHIPQPAFRGGVDLVGIQAQHHRVGILAGRKGGGHLFPSIHRPRQNVAIIVLQHGASAEIRAVAGDIGIVGKHPGILAVFRGGFAVHGLLVEGGVGDAHAVILVV